MKQLFNHTITKTILLLMILHFSPFERALSQDSIPQKFVVDLKLTYSRENNDKRYVAISVTQKEGGKIIPVKWAIVNLYLNEITKLGMLGNVTTDDNGTGTIPLDKKFVYVVDSLHLTNHYTFIASLQNNPQIEAAMTAVQIEEAALNLVLFEEGSIRKGKAVLKKLADDGSYQPVAGSNIVFAVKRDTGYVPLTAVPVQTNADGVAAFDFPEKMEGDSSDVLHIVAMTEEADHYGILIAGKNTNWGTPSGFFNKKGNIIALILSVLAVIVFIYLTKMKSKK